MVIGTNNVELNFGIYQVLVGNIIAVPYAVGSTCVLIFWGMEWGASIWVAHPKIYEVKNIPVYHSRNYHVIHQKSCYPC